MSVACPRGPFRSVLTIAAALSLANAAALFAQPKPDARPLVAVMALSGQGVEGSSSRIVSDALADELMRTGKVRVMERSQVEKILKEQGFQKSGACDATDCAVEMGRLLAIDRVVVGTLGKLGESYSLSLRVVEVKTGAVMAGSRRLRKGEIEGVLTEMVPDASKELVAGMAGQTMERTVVMQASPEELEAQEARKEREEELRKQEEERKEEEEERREVLREQLRKEMEEKRKQDALVRDSVTGWEKRLFRIALGGGLDMVRPASTVKEFGVEGGFGLTTGVKIRFNVLPHLMLGGGMGTTMTTLTLRRDGLYGAEEEQVSVNGVEVHGEVAWRIDSYFTLGVEAGLVSAMSGSSSSSSSSGGSSSSSSSLNSWFGDDDDDFDDLRPSARSSDAVAAGVLDTKEAPETYSYKSSDVMYVDDYPYVGLRAGFQPAYRLLLEAYVRAGITGILAKYEKSGSQFQKRDPTRANNIVMNQAGLGVYFLF